MINQVEVNVFQQQNNIHEFNQSKDIQTEAWAPFAEGKNNFFNNETIKRIGYKYNKSIAQVVTRWLLQRNMVLLSKSVNESRIKGNIDVFDFELTDDDIRQIQKFDVDESQFFDVRNPETTR